MWQNSRAVQREDPRAHLCRAFLLTLKSLPRIKNIGEDWERARIHLSTRSCQNYKTQTVVPKHCELQHFYIQLFRERLSEKLCTRQSRKVSWDMINTQFLAMQLSNPLLLLSFSTRKHMSMASRAILSNFFEKQ